MTHILQDRPASRIGLGHQPGRTAQAQHAHHSGCPICLTTSEHPTESAARQAIIDHAASVHDLHIDPVKIGAESCPVCLARVA